MKILVIFTGGTIGSSVEDGWITTDSDTKYKLIELYRKRHNDLFTEFNYVTPYFVLSENLSATELTKLAKCIQENIQKDYDGIIVTHGTDTLQYTSAALSFMFADANLPIVLVSSAFPLEDCRANGVDNFNAAVKFINAKAGTGLFVSYKNSFENTVNVHNGTRVISHMEASADVFSIDGNPYAFYKDENIVCNKYFVGKKTGRSIGAIDFCDYPDVLVIDSHPGDRFNYDPQDYKAIVLVPFHSATLNTDNERFKVFLKKANLFGIPVFLVNASSGTQYESTKIYDDFNITVLPMCTKSAIYMKCWIAVSKGENIKDFVTTPITEEFI